MSNGNGGNNCGKFIRQGERIYVYDTKDEERAKANPGLKIGPIAVYSLSEYRDRVVAVQLTGNARYMFDRPEQHESLSDDEMQSIATHAGSGALNLRHFQHDGAEVIARQSRSDLDMTDPEIQRYDTGAALVYDGPLIAEQPPVAAQQPHTPIRELAAA